MDSLLNTYLNLLKMSKNDPRYEAMLFNYETTMRNDFRNGAILELKRTVYEEKPKCLRISPPPLKDIHTLTDWKTPYVRIDLLVTPKEVVHTDPRKRQEKYVEVPDDGLEEARATRPRLVMTPSVSMDDIQDKEQWKLLTREMYTTSTKKSLDQTIPLDHELCVKAPLIGKLAAANPLSLKKLNVPYVSPEWRMDSVSWDNRQLRGHCDPDRQFFLDRTPKCNVCDETAARVARHKMITGTKK